MKPLHFSGFFRSFLHWSGWSRFAALCRRAWRGIRSWAGWKRLFGIPIVPLLVLALVCAAGLVWVFAHGRSLWSPSYFLYALSTYTLTALCIKLPVGLRRGKQWVARHPKLSSALTDKDKRFQRKLILDQFLNFAYGLFKLHSGIVCGSAWMGSDGTYTLTQSLIQLYQILRRKRAGTLEQQWRSYRFCGFLILLLHLTLIGVVFQMLTQTQTKTQGQIQVIATAAFAFYKFTTSFLKLAKDRKHIHPVDSSVRMLKLAQAIFAIFSLQVSMILTFGTGEAWERPMNTTVGCIVCLLVVAMGLYMIRRGNRELKTLQEAEHG